MGTGTRGVFYPSPREADLDSTHDSESHHAHAFSRPTNLISVSKSPTRLFLRESQQRIKQADREIMERAQHLKGNTQLALQARQNKERLEKCKAKAASPVGITLRTKAVTNPYLKYAQRQTEQSYY